MFSLFPKNIFRINNKKKRLIYLFFFPIAMLISILWANAIPGYGDPRSSFLRFGVGVFFLLFCILLFSPKMLHIIELFAFFLGAVWFISIVQITLYIVITNSSDARLLSDVTNGLSMWMIVILGVAYFTLDSVQIKALINFITISMLVMAVVNYFFIPPFGIKTIPYVFRWLNSIGAFIVIALIFRWMGIQQKEQASTDALTGFFNRFALNKILAQEMERSERFHKPFSVLLLDLDYFKRVNDTYGHPEGDIVLEELSKLIRKNIRKFDHVGRWGGEEFLLVMPETGKDIAWQIAERLRKKISENPLGKVDKLTASFGIATYEFGQGLEKTLIRMDNALYQAKENGRDRSVIL